MCAVRASVAILKAASPATVTPDTRLMTSLKSVLVSCVKGSFESEWVYEVVNWSNNYRVLISLGD